MDTFTVLADPTRRVILDTLLQQPRTVGELVDMLPYSQPNISKHLRVLREADLVTVRIDAQRRWYEINPQPLAEIHAWLESYKHLWEGRLERLGEYLQELQKGEKADDEQP